MLAAALCFCIVVTSCPGMPTALSVSAAQQQDDNMTAPGEGEPGDDTTEPGEGTAGDDTTEPEEGGAGGGTAAPGEDEADDGMTGSGEGEPGDDTTEPQKGGAEDSNGALGNGEADENVELPDNGENTQAAPSADAAAEPVMTGWHFGEDAVYPKGDLFYEEGVYRLVLGGSREVQIPFEEIVSLLPTSVTVELTYPVSDHADSTGELSDMGASDGDLSVGNAGSEGGVSVLRDEVVLPVTGWSCSEYVCDAEGYLPYRGSFFFLVQLGEEAADSFGEGTARIGVEVVFDEPMILAEMTDVAPGTITSDQTWGAQTLPAGTYTINPGVTVTLTGRLTVSGNVTINGGGTIVRDAGYTGADSTSDRGRHASLLYVETGTLILENITVDGKSVYSYGQVAYVERSGILTLESGAVIQNNQNMNTGTAGTCSAGAVYCEGTLNINGGTIRNCSTRQDGKGFSHAGGGIYLKGTCNMTAGFITGNTASNGGGIYLASSGAKLNLTGGTISDNYAERYGDGIYYSTVYDADSSLLISGNVNVADVIYLDNSTGVICPKITSKLKYSISLACSSTTEGRSLAQGEGYTLTDADAAKVSMMDTNLRSKLDSASNSIVLRVVHQHSVSGGSDTQEVFAEFDENAVRLTSGSYYLAGDVSLDHSLTVAKGSVVNLCLNGHKLEYSGSDKVSVIVVEPDATLNICDCDGAHGSHTFTSPATNQSVTITGGLITRSKPVDMVGSGIYVNSGGICNFYGGSVAGISDTGTSSISGSHGAVRVEGVFQMYNGAITHNRSGCGGGVNVCSMGSNNACFYLHGGSISYNYADYNDGGGICLNTQCSFVMEGGEIKGNRAKSGGGGIHCYGNGNSVDAVRLTGGTITGNTTGGNVGGGIYCENTERPLNVSGTIRITGNTNASGKESNLYLCSNKTLSIESGLSGNAVIGITTEISPTSGNPVNITGKNAGDYSGYFISDHPDYEIMDSAGHEVQLTYESDEDKVEETKKVVEQVLSGLTADNSTTKEQIQNQINEALSAAGIGSDVAVRVDDFKKTEATSSAEGSISGTVTITSGGASENVTIDKPIAKLAGTGEEGGNPGSTGGNGNSGSTGGNGNSGSSEDTGGSGNPGSNDGSGGSSGINGSAGSIISEVIAQDSTSETGFATPTEELADCTLTPEEKQQAQGGTDIRIILHVEDASERVSAEEKAVVEANLSGYAIGQYLDISLYKLVGESRTQITETSGKIRITFEIPESLRLSESGGTNTRTAEEGVRTRQFAILRIHDGQAEILPDLDDNVDTITIETDRFSTYVLVFLDKEADDEEAGMGTADAQAESGSSSGSTAGTASGQGKDDEPKTGDVSQVELYATLSMIAGLTYLLTYFADCRHGMSEETKKELVSKLIAWAKKGKNVRRYLALAAIFMLLVYYHSIGKKTSVKWKEVYGK